MGLLEELWYSMIGRAWLWDIVVRAGHSVPSSKRMNFGDMLSYNMISFFE